MHMKHSLFGLAVSVIFLCGPACSAESTNELRETCEAVARAETLPVCIENLIRVDAATKSAKLEK
jgi:hypothetical protein